MLIGLLAIGSICNLAVSCNSDVEEKDLSENDLNSSSFMSSIDGSLDSFMDTRVVINDSDVSLGEGGMRAQTHVLNTQNLYVDLSCVESPIALEPIVTPGQILDLVKTTGAEISLINDGTYTHTLTISEDESVKALKPLIQDSKKYLYMRGFSENEIQQMLKENDADESALVPFVLALAEEEEYQQMELSTVFYTNTRSIDWKKAGGCALYAIGADVLSAYKHSGAKTWSKVILKRVFKTVASRLLGPVGAVIAVIEFSYCYWGV